MLERYRRSGSYTDCYVTQIIGVVTLPTYITAFYTTPLFRLERSILKWLVNKPSTDEDAQLFADGRAQRFAAWYVEDQDQNQLLVSDFRDDTRSWFMTESVTEGGGLATRLYFGSAVVKTAEKRKSTVFRVLLPFHKLYSRALLWSARARLSRAQPSVGPVN